MEKTTQMNWVLCVLAASILSPSLASERVELGERHGVQEMIVSVSSLDAAISIYEQAADWSVLYRSEGNAELAAFWNVPGVRSGHVVMGLPSTDKGRLRLVKFHDVQQQRIRSSARPFDTGGIFNINALTKDLEGSFGDLRSHAFQGFADPTYYSIFGRRYGGALLRGHDGVVINLLHRVDQPWDDLPNFTKLSHIRNATQMVANYEESFRFFTEQLGWDVRWEAEPTWPEDGANNMGLPNSLLISGQVQERAASFRASPDADGGSIEIFAFEGISGRDYSARAVPPNLGILMYLIHWPGLADYAKTIRDRGVSPERPLSNISLPPYGDVRAMMLKAPSGALLMFFEQKA